MKKNLLQTFAMALFTVFSGSAIAQPQQLSLEQALRLGMESSKQLNIAESKIISAHESVNEAASNHLPKVTFQGGYTRLSDVPVFQFALPGTTNAVTIVPVILNNFQMKVGVQQPIFTGFRNQSMQHAAEYSEKATIAEQKKDRVDMSYSIKSNYWNLFKATEFRQVANENIATLQSRLRDAEIMEKSGLLTRNDVLKIQVQLSEAKLRQLDAENNVRLSAVSLNNIIGQPLNTPVEVISTPRTASAVSIGKSEELLSEAKKNRPDVASAEFRTKAAHESITAAESAWYPQVHLAGNFYYNNPNQRFVPIAERFDATWDVGVQISMDLWNWGATGNKVEQAQQQLQQSQQQLGLIQDGINVEITQSYLTAMQGIEKISVAKQTVEQSLENQRVYAQRFKNGMATGSDMLDADFSVLQAKINYTQTLVEYELALARLNKAQGLE